MKIKFIFLLSVIFSINATKHIWLHCQDGFLELSKENIPLYFSVLQESKVMQELQKTLGALREKSFLQFFLALTKQEVYSLLTCLKKIDNQKPSLSTIIMALRAAHYFEIPHKEYLFCTILAQRLCNNKKDLDRFKKYLHCQEAELFFKQYIGIYCIKNLVKKVLHNLEKKEPFRIIKTIINPTGNDSLQSIKTLSNDTIILGYIAGLNPEQGNIKIINLETGVIKIIPGIKTHAVAVLNPDTVFCLTSGKIKRLDLKSGCMQETNLLQEYSWEFTIISETIIAMGSVFGLIKLFDFKNNMFIKQWRAHFDDRIHALSVLPNNKLISGTEHGVLRIWDLTTYSCLQELKIDDSILSISPLSPNKILLGTSKGIKIWDLKKNICTKLQHASDYLKYYVTKISDYRIASVSWHGLWSKQHLELWAKPHCEKFSKLWEKEKSITALLQEM